MSTQQAGAADDQALKRATTSSSIFEGAGLDAWHRGDDHPVFKKASDVFKSGALKQLRRTVTSPLGVSYDKPVVVVDSLFGLDCRLLSGKPFSLDCLRGKVTLVVNVASK